MNTTANATTVTRRTNTKDMVLLSMFTAIILLMAATPIGLIDLPLIKATILHVPVIIGAILMGPKKGAFLGAVFGLTSIVKNTMVPGVLSFAFSPLIAAPGTQHGSPWALFISLVPRMLIGPAAWAVYKLLNKLLGRKLGRRALWLAIAAVVGALVNTGLVMSTIGIVFRQAYAAANGIPVEAVVATILGVVGTNGVPEAICAAVIVPLVTLPLQKALKLENA